MVENWLGNLLGWLIVIIILGVIIIAAFANETFRYVVTGLTLMVVLGYFVNRPKY